MSQTHDIHEHTLAMRIKKCESMAATKKSTKFILWPTSHDWQRAGKELF
jgi:hypothetical protein